MGLGEGQVLISISLKVSKFQFKPWKDNTYKIVFSFSSCFLRLVLLVRRPISVYKYIYLQHTLIDIMNYDKI